MRDNRKTKHPDANDNCDDENLQQVREVAKDDACRPPGGKG